jgi:membrane protease YdiL (CAAX protease family)
MKVVCRQNPVQSYLQYTDIPRFPAPESPEVKSGDDKGDNMDASGKVIDTADSEPKKKNAYIALSDTGHNEWWRYLFTMAVVIWLVFTIALTTLTPLILRYGVDVGPGDIGTLLWLAVNLAPFPFAILGLWAGLRWLHRRPFSTLLAVGRFRWDWLAFSAGLWLVLSAFGDVVLSVMQPGNYAFAFNINKYLPFAVVVLALIPLQIGAEELVFRGYLTQAIGRLGGFWLALILPAIIFGLLHGSNPEVGQYGVWLTMPSYIGIGLLMGWLTLKTGGLEMALGLHLANNLYASLFVTFPSSALPTPALWQINTLHPAQSLVMFFAASVIFLLVFYSLRRRHIFKR